MHNRLGRITYRRDFLFYLYSRYRTADPFGTLFFLGLYLIIFRHIPVEADIDKNENYFLSTPVRKNYKVQVTDEALYILDPWEYRSIQGIYPGSIIT